MRVEPLLYGEKRVYPVAAFNRGVGSWLKRLPTVWVEGEMTELRRQPRWQRVFFTLKDLETGAALAASMPRSAFDALRLELADGDRVHVYGRPELWEARGLFQLQALTIEPFGEGAVLLELERLRRRLAAEGLFAAERKRPLPFLPRRIGLVTGNDAAARHDVVTTIRDRFPPARLLVAETTVQGPRAAARIAETMRAVCEAGVDVIVLARGGGSFDDLLPFSDERLVRAIAACPVPVVSAIGHEQDTPLCDFAADARVSTPTAAARAVVPDWVDLVGRLRGSHGSLARGLGRTVERRREQIERDRTRLIRAPGLLLERKRTALEATHERLSRAPRLDLERRQGRITALGGRLQALAPSATLRRGYAIVRRGEEIVRDAGSLRTGERVDVELAEGGFGARVEDTIP